MAAPYSFGFIGNGLTRVFALALPSPQVRAWLPAGIELGEQHLTPRGMHPVVFLFHTFSECQFSFPTFLRSMNFHEQTFGIPFTYVRGAGRPGPFYYMPRLYLDSTWVLMNGTFWWGFRKTLAAVDVSDRRYTVTARSGRPLASLQWSPDGNGHRAVAGCREFEPLREVLSQTLVTVFPAAVGPCLSLTDFDRRWNLATVRPLHSSLEIDPSYMTGFKGGRFATDRPTDPDAPVLGSFELEGPWWLSLPYAGSSRPWYS